MMTQRMSRIDESILLSVNRIRTTFQDIGGLERTGAGTGFWVSLRREKTTVPAFVTNRHNLDPEMQWPGQELKLIESKIELRKQTADDELQSETSWISIPTKTWRLHPEADCAAVIDPDFAEQQQGFLPIITSYIRIATQFELENIVFVMDLASFVGFPGNKKGMPWWDTFWTLPIARLATLASPPSMPFTNPHINKLGNVGLVSGLSFNGSSGSPLLPHNIPSQNTSMIIGIMSGHFSETEPEIFRHSGLSYYTRSPAIREVLGLVP